MKVVNKKGILIYNGGIMSLTDISMIENIPVSELSLEYSREDILQVYERKMKALTSKYTEEEQKTWQTQLEEAKAYLANNTTPTLMLTEIADGTDIQTLAQNIVAKAEFLKIESGKLLAWKNRELAKIK